MLKSGFLVIVQANLLLHLLLRLLLPRQLRRLLPLRIQAQLLQHRLHHLRLLQAVLLKIIPADQIILAPMACAVVSGVIVVLQKHTADNAARITVMDSLLHHLRVQAHPLQVLLQTILRRLLDIIIMLITEKIVASLHMLGTGRLVLLMSKLMLILTL